MLEPEPLDIDSITEPARFPLPKVVAITVVSLLLLAVVAAFAVPPLLPAATARAVAAWIVADLAGQPVRITGDASLRLLPTISVDASNLALGNPAAPRLTVRRAALELGPLALLTGHVEVHDLSLQGPTLDLTAAAATPAEKSGEDGNWGQFRGLLIDRIEVRDGRLSYPAPLGGGTIQVAGISLDGGTHGDRELRIAGSLHAGPSDGRIEMVLTQPSAFVGGNAVPLEVHFRTGGDSLDFNGTVAKRTRFAGQGRLAVSFSDPAHLAAWLGNTPTALDGLGFKFSTQIDTAGAGVGFRDLDLRFGGLKLQGVLSLVGHGAKQQITGTLHTETLRLGPLLTTALGSGGGGNGVLAALPRLFPDGGGEVDVEWQNLQVDGLTGGAGRLTLGRGDDGKIEATTDEMPLAGGRARFSGTLAAGEGMMALSAKLRLIGVDMRQLLAPASGAAPPLSGTANLELDLLTVGATPDELAAALTGHGAFTVQGGEVSDPALVDALASSAGQDSLPFQSFTGSFKIAHGILKSDDVLLKAKDLGIIASGQVDLAKQAVRFRLDALRNGKGKQRQLKSLILDGSTSAWRVHPAEK